MPDNLSERRSSDIIRDFEAKVRKGCLRSGLTDVKGHLLVGFSGGADSTALLLSLKSLMSGGGRWPASLVAVHVEHGLRPGSSERDARHAEEFCQSHKISFRRVGVRVEESGGRGLEDAARRARRRA
ncbi:MAG: ATP-binding protein, partial [Nitrospinota bacterium]|nr:ATP-binding protein [Nitrospinota bacterium]